MQAARLRGRKQRDVTGWFGNIKGMAVKFHLPGGTEVDLAMLAVKTFPMVTGEGFRDLLMAISESPDNAPKPTGAG